MPSSPEFHLTILITYDDDDNIKDSFNEPYRRATRKDCSPWGLKF